jgi:hypothetical protein
VFLFLFFLQWGHIDPMVLLTQLFSWYQSRVNVQRAFRSKYTKDPPTDKTVREWYKQFTETGCLCKQKSIGRPLTAEDDDKRFRASPKKSTGNAAIELSMTIKTVWRVQRKRSVFSCYKYL